MKKNKIQNILGFFTEQSLVRNITIVIVFAVAFISVFSLAIHLRITSNTNQKQFDQKSRQQISYLKESLQLPLWNYNFEAVKKLGQMMMTSDIISFLSIIDGNGKNVFADEKDGGTNDVVKNIDVDYRDRHVGSFEIRLTKLQYDNQQEGMIITAVVTFLALISGILITVMLSINWFVKKPLSDFSRRIDSLAKGEYRHDRALDEYIELRNVMDSFNQMSVKIEKREKSLLESKNALEIEIAERKKTEQMLRESEEKYRSLNNNIPVGIFRIKPSGEIVDYNAFLLKILNIPANTDITSLQGEKFYSDPEDRKTIFKKIARDKEISGFECRLKSWDNKEIWASVSARGIEDSSSEIKYIDGIAEDITEKKAYEKQLEKFAAIIEQADEEVVITDPEGIIQYVNPSFEKNTGYTSDEVFGKKTSILKSGFHEPDFYENLWQTILNKKIWKNIIINKNKDGNIFHHDTTITPIVGSKNEISSFVSIRRDITKQVELENQIQQSQKMQAIGTLAGGIAHDFNNILSGIFGYCQLAQMNIQNTDKATDCISNAVKAAQRATELVQQILTFSRQTEYEKSPFCVYLEVNEALKLIRSSIPATIDIKKQLDSRAMVLADPAKIHQVVMNLCTNAYHSMRKTGGVITACLSDLEIAGLKQVRDKKMPPGKYLLFEISDTGHGMDKKTLDKAFEPYFTTKERGEGTGLGLAIVQAVVDEHDGFLEVFSTPGEGTRFHLYFPIVEKHTTSGKEKSKGSISFDGNETVLLVDDEEDIRQTYKQIIENSGYKVVVFGDGKKALDAFKSDPGKFDVMITDMTMPGITGAELIEKIKSINKDFPIILCSGFSELMNENKAQQMGVNRYLMKPLPANDLVKNIRELLDEN